MEDTTLEVTGRFKAPRKAKTTFVPDADYSLTRFDAKEEYRQNKTKREYRTKLFNFKRSSLRDIRRYYDAECPRNCALILGTVSTNKFSVVVICAPLDSSQPYEEVGLYPGARTIARLARDSQVRYPNIGDLVMLDKSHQFIVAPLANPSSFEALFLGSNRYSDPSLLSMHRDISRRELRNQWGNELGVEPPRSKREKKLHALRGLEIICSELRIMKAQASVLSVIAGGVEPHNEKNMVFTFFPLLKGLGAAVMSDVIADAVPTLPYDVANTVSSFEYFSPLSQEVLLALFTGRKGYKHWIDRGGNVCAKIFRRQMKPRYCGSLRGRESLSREIESDSESSSSDSSTEIIDYALITYMFLHH